MTDHELRRLSRVLRREGLRRVVLGRSLTEQVARGEVTIAEAERIERRAERRISERLGAIATFARGCVISFLLGAALAAALLGMGLGIVGLLLASAALLAHVE